MEKSSESIHQQEIDINLERKKFQQEEEFRINIIQNNLKNPVTVNLLYIKMMKKKINTKVRLVLQGGLFFIFSATIMHVMTSFFLILLDLLEHSVLRQRTQTFEG